MASPGAEIGAQNPEIKRIQGPFNSPLGISGSVEKLSSQGRIPSLVHIISLRQHEIPMPNPSFLTTPEELYHFDLRGYLVVRNVLTSVEVAALNEAIDGRAEEIRARDAGSLSGCSSALEGSSGRQELTGMLGWPSPQRELFRDLLVHPVVVSRLNNFSGRGFRLDHGPLLIQADAGTEGHSLHGAGEPFSAANWYHQQNGRILCRGVTVAWQLSDVNEGDGGFAVVPGSHKSQEQAPQGIRSVEDDMGLVVQPAMNAGDVLFFAETATHGALPWTASHQRRSVLYKYASRDAARAAGRYFDPKARWGAWTADMTPEEQAIMYGPGVHGPHRRYLLDSDGETVGLAE